MSEVTTEISSIDLHYLSVFSFLSYIVSLLNKFEVALTWDSRTLLIPSLLPLQEAASYNDGTTVKLLQRVRGRSHNLGCSVSQELNLNKLIYEQHSPRASAPTTACNQGLRRMLLMTYFPSGFWSRLITRVLADEQIIEAIRGVYVAAQDVSDLMNLRDLFVNFTIVL